VKRRRELLPTYRKYFGRLTGEVGGQLTRTTACL
jgi:hypothetical protein